MKFSLRLSFGSIGWLLVALFTGQVALAQPGACILNGIVRDAGSGQPVAYATVLLLPPAPASQVLASTVANAQGQFALASLAAGDFRLQVSFVGYATHTQPVRLAQGALVLAPILLAVAAQELAEAVVVGHAPLVEAGQDRLVYHADQDAGNAGTTAAEVLRKTPLLAVDGQGNVTMRGSANFQVLVNGQPAPTLAQNLPQALRGLPADQILRVEVIPTPSAKYDGEGTAGIINIVLKKGADRGRTGRFGTSGGNRASELTAAFISNRGKLNFTTAASAGTWYEPDRLTRRRLGFTAAGPDTLRQSGDRQTQGTWYNTNLALDYDPAAHHRFSLAGSLSGYRATAQQDLLTRFTAPDASQNQLFTRATTSPVSSLSTEATGTYTRTFAQARREWSVLAQYAHTASAFGYDFDQFTNSATALGAIQADYRERSQSHTPSQEITGQSDFTQPFGDKKTLEIGLKAIFRRTGAEAEVAGAGPGSMPSFVPLAGRGTDFKYAQNVQAAYAIYSTSVSNKLTASLGSRFEHTALAAEFGSGLPALRRTYGSLLPTGAVRYAFTDTSSVRLAYSRRLTRPAIDYLNPFVDRSNAQNITYGNPALAPEATDSYELSYATQVKTVTVALAGSVRHTGNAIETVRLPTTTAGVTAQTFANVAANTFYQLTAYGTAHPLPQWEVSGGPNVQYIARRSPNLGLIRHGLTAGMSIDTSFKFRRTLVVQGSFAGALPTPTLQGQGAANLAYTVGVKKTLLRDQAELALNLTNPFTDSVPYRSTVASAFFDEQTEYRAYQRAFRLSFNYRFGQEQPGRPRKQVTNDDRK
jgi:outer membrane receptor protein involved in Fe transport